MDDIIEQLATIHFDESLLANAKVDDIYHDFNAHYGRLDDLKKFRSDFEQKNFLSRWWNSDQLQDAQLSSTEVQAAFSKTIGQLMLISIAQSKKLTQQQLDLSKQQGELTKQSTKISDQAEKLAMQNDELVRQSVEQDRLIKESRELKGLTEDSVKKLIAIANEVKSTKDDLLAQFEPKIHAANELIARNEQLLVIGIAEQKQSFDARSQELNAWLDAEAAKLNVRQEVMVASLAQDKAERLAQAQGAQTALQVQQASVAALSQAQTEQAAAQQSRLGQLERQLQEADARQQGQIASLKKMVFGLAICSVLVLGVLIFKLA